jgi:hypothetical protein
MQQFDISLLYCILLEACTVGLHFSIPLNCCSPAFSDELSINLMMHTCRDLKLDNTLLEACIVGLPRIKICDFGFAKRWGAAGDQMHTAIGTPVYMSPQVRICLHIHHLSQQTSC